MPTQIVKECIWQHGLQPFNTCASQVEISRPFYMAAKATTVTTLDAVCFWRIFLHWRRHLAPFGAKFRCKKRIFIRLIIVPKLYVCKM